MTAHTGKIDPRKVTIRYLGDYYAYPGGVLLKGDTLEVPHHRHWAVLIKIGAAEVVAK